MDYYGSMYRTLRAVALALTASLLTAPALLAQNTDPVPLAEPNSAMDGQLFYQLLLGEVNARGGEPGLGFQLILDAARKTGDARLYRRATDIALQGRSGESALQAARAWRQAMPDSRDANRYLLQILIGLNRLNETVEPLKRELVAATDNTERIGAIGSIPRLFTRSTDKKLAASVAEQALSEYLANPTLGASAWTTIGRMRIDAADIPGAMDAVRRGHALDPLAEAPAVLALSLVDSNLPDAESIVRAHLAGKARAEYRMDYARILINNQRLAEAQAQLAQITAETPAFAPAWLVKGILELQDRKDRAAEASMLRYVELESARGPAAASAEETRRGLTQAYMALAEIAERKKDLAGARSWLDRIEDSQEMVNVQVRRAALLARQGQLNEGRALLQALPARNPAEARAKVSAEVQLLRDNKQFQQAHDLLNEALAASPQDLDFMYDKAMMAEKLGRLDEMERLLRAAIAIKPDYHHAYNALGYSLADRNVRLPEARALILKALEFAPGDPYITDSLGWVEFRSGNFPEALRLLRQAYQDKPDAEIAAHLGEVLWMLGERTKAMEIWREGLALNAENETLLETLKRLRVKL